MLTKFSSDCAGYMARLFRFDCSIWRRCRWRSAHPSLPRPLPDSPASPDLLPLPHPAYCQSRLLCGPGILIVPFQLLYELVLTGDVWLRVRELPLSALSRDSCLAAYSYAPRRSDSRRSSTAAAPDGIWRMCQSGLRRTQCDQGSISIASPVEAGLDQRGSSSRLLEMRTRRMTIPISSQALNPVLRANEETAGFSSRSPGSVWPLRAERQSCGGVIDDHESHARSIHHSVTDSSYEIRTVVMPP